MYIATFSISIWIEFSHFPPNCKREFSRKVVTGKTKELSGDATIAAGILSKLMPLSLEGSAGYQSSTQSK